MFIYVLCFFLFHYDFQEFKIHFIDNDNDDCLSITITIF